MNGFPTTNLALAEALPNLSFDQIGRAWGHYNEAAVASAHRSPWATVCMNRRAMVGDEASRRGVLIRRSLSGDYLCGYPADFEPIAAR